MSPDIQNNWSFMTELFRDGRDNKDNIKARKPEKFTELLAILTKEHEEIFKDVTLEAQLDKFVDEQKEFKQAKNCLEEAREMADMFIVAAGIARFAPVFVKEVMLPMLVDKIKKSEAYNKEMIAELALEKSLINKNRKWDKKGGKYQHK